MLRGRPFALNASRGNPPVLDDYLKAGVFDNGNNTFTIRYGFDQNTLLENSVIVGLGSSTMHGAGASSNETQLKTLLENYFTTNLFNSTWYSFSLNGYFTDKFMPYGTSSLVDFHRNIDVVLAVNPNVVILSLPSNDIAENTNDEFISNLIAIDERCRERNCYLFVTQTQPRNNYTSEQQQRLRDCAALIKSVFGRRCIEIFDELVDEYSVATPARMKPVYDAGDSIHCNDAGHAYIFQQTLLTLSSFFTSNPYSKFAIQRSLTEDFAEFDVLEDNIEVDVFTKTYPREDSELYYYRVVATISGGLQSISNIVTLQQPIYVGDVDQTVQINFAVSTDQVGAAGWNDLVASGDIPNAGETFGPFVDSTNVATGIGLQIIGTFDRTGDNGDSGGTVVPDAAARSYWGTAQGSSLDNGDQAAVKITGLDDNYTYSIDIFSSRNTSDPSRILAIKAVDKIATISAGTTNGGNEDTLVTLSGLIPVGGEITIYLGTVVYPVAYLNAMYLKKHDNIFKVRFDVDAMALVDPDFQVNDINGPNITKVNFTGSTGAGLSSWFDVNVVAGTTFSLENSEGNPVNLTVTVSNIAGGTLDNGATYGGTDTFPAQVLRYVRYRTLGFTVTIGGCDPTKTYELLLTATRLSFTATNRFTINGVAQTLSVSNNIGNYVTFSGIIPDANNRIVITVDNANGGTAHLSAMIINESVDEGGLTVQFNPDALVLTDPGFDAIIPVKFVFDPDVMQLTDPDFEVRGQSDPFVFDPDVMQLTDPGFNIGQSFVPDVISLVDPTFTAQGSAQSPYTFTKGHFYNGINDSYIYTPPGYPDNSDNYPVVIFLHGASVNNVDQAIAQGPGLRINLGDRPTTPWGDKALIAIPHIGANAAWSPGLVQGMYTYMRQNYRVDPDRVYLTGLSLGGNGATKAMQDANSTPYGPRNLLYSAVFMVCGSIDNNFNYNLIKHAGWWTLHGTLDETQDGNNTPKLLLGYNAVGPIQPALSTWYYNVGHNIYTDHTYNRFNKTNSSGVRVGGPARMDWFEWIMKFSRDQVRNAELHVIFAETGTNWTHQYLDYLLALKLVTDLPASGTKTSLTTRLTNLKATLDGGGRRFIIDFGESGKESTGFVNNMTNFNTGATISNLVEDDGTASSIGFQVVTRSSTDVDGVNFDQRFNMPYHGLQANTYRDGFALQYGGGVATQGVGKLTGLDNTKKYEILIFHISNVASKPLQNENKAELRVSIGGVIKTEYSEMNTMYPIFYGRAKLGLNNNIDQSVSPTSGEITMNWQVNTGAYTSRNTYIQTMIIFEI